MIPGTHNSGAYDGIATFLENYILNQDRSIWTQLVFGIRYFDLRVGYYEKDGFFINHDLVRISPLIPILQEIRKFLSLAPKEIVVIDFHRFPFPTQFNNDIHRKLHNVIRDQLEDLAFAPNGLQAGKGPTLNEIWQQKKNVIICYGKLEIARGECKNFLRAEIRGVTLRCEEFHKVNFQNIRITGTLCLNTGVIRTK